MTTTSTEQSNLVKHRTSSEGYALPSIGMILDPPLALSLDDPDATTVELANPVVVNDGTLDDAWHVLTVRRPLLPLFIGAGGPDAGDERVTALHRLGVTQVLGASIGMFVPQHLDGDTCVIPSVVRTRGHEMSLCPRLRVALLTAAGGCGFQVVDVDDGFDLGSTPLAVEHATAHDAGMCHAAIDVSYRVESGVDNLVVMLEAIMRATPLAISPLGSCDCRG
jgi:hypothetical protein